MEITIEPFIFLFSLLITTILSLLSCYSLLRKREKMVLFLFLILMAVQILQDIIGLTIIKKYKIFYIGRTNELSITYRFFEILFEIIHKNIFFMEIPESFIIIYIIIRSFLYISSLLLIQLPVLSIYLQNMFNISENFLLIFILFSQFKRYKTKNLRNTLIFRSFLIRQRLLKKLYILQYLIEIIYSSVMIYMCLVFYSLILYETIALLRIVSIVCLYFCIVGQDEDVMFKNCGVVFMKRSIVEPNVRCAEGAY
ncbi:hypothetical protein DMUE_0335 [Dictyocoela muelleri]|nr:hypothetical protein DMUE_0335 [Dictyocoela muelleri]